jgi:hypothetical protein
LPSLRSWPPIHTSRRTDQNFRKPLARMRKLVVKFLKGCTLMDVRV